MERLRNLWAGLMIIHDLQHAPFEWAAGHWPQNAPMFVFMGWAFELSTYAWMLSVFVAGLRAQSQWCQSFGKPKPGPSKYHQMPDGSWMTIKHDVETGQPILDRDEYDKPRFAWFPVSQPRHMKPEIKGAKVKASGAQAKAN